MLRPKVRITFSQQPTDTYPDRSQEFVMPFITHLEIHSSWKNLTDTASLRFPKSIVVRTAGGSDYDISGQGRNLVAGDANQPPFFMRGDRIKIEACYWHYDSQGIEIQEPFVELFNGFVTKVYVGVPVELEAEDYMYRLKQVKAANKLYKGSQYNIEDVVKDLVAQFNAASPNDQITFQAPPGGVTTNIGDFRVQDNTIAQVLDWLRTNAHINSWFRGTALHSSLITYYPGEAQDPAPIFVFNSINANILPGAELEYTRSDDVRMGVKAYSVQKELTSKLNVNGKKQSVHKRIEAFVGDTEGEIRTYYSANATTKEQLIKEATEWMRRWHYEGFRGSFTTLGEPVVFHGDQIEIRDMAIPDRNGRYFVKAVTRQFGKDGYRQIIEPDLRIDGIFDDAAISQGI
jgi:hypothetical protein